ncbi:non-reducing end alpha-L-arabinofuranosidase family hydrolase [Streptomyces sp. VRA16 Mangrove soil]|uniref:non-reducing end alpha-L-arabinofuranosidase family hydrolase n=1 Tax=Streptomyces sp. VRA16 Mangrove soil TaxID=2817434 RepID=UPI001A9DBCEF|nr:non-reducing end alpha-L-arabinofuranosidase family hydrolase [Streptomyces sp. VRA16 Mangrove soil]MBO1331415.1 RICIN domain-containing protein [Streptomyces sp. VRA16 Mangrove soil]
MTAGRRGDRGLRRGRRGTVAVTVAALLAGLCLALTAAPASAASVDTGAWYVLVNRGSGKALDVTDRNADNGTGMQQYTRNDGAWQQWRFVDTGNGTYEVRSRFTGKVLDVAGASTADGARIQQWDDAGGTNQRFTLADSTDGYVRLIGRGSGKAVGVSGSSTADGAAVVQATDTQAAAQQWQLVRTATVSTALTSSPSWVSTGVLAGPQSDATHSLASIKDFSVIRYNGKYHVYATTASTSGGWNLEYFSFDKWADAASATQHYLDASGIGTGYRAAPQVFYNSAQALWYMVYQTGPPTYSTTTDPSDPSSWSAPKTFIASEPAVVTQNKGNGGWIDFWTICDTSNCYLFFSDDNGHLYRAQTSLANFPNGFGNTQIVMTDSKYALFEASNVYKVSGTGQYLLVVEAIGANGRYFRSWTSSSLTGTWSPQATTESAPFAGKANVSFNGSAWTNDISHGEMVRASNDQTLTIDPCHLQYVYQGRDPSSGGDYSQLPYRMGLLTQSNSSC